MDADHDVLKSGLALVAALFVAACFPELGEYVSQGATGGAGGGLGGAGLGGQAGGGPVCNPLDEDNPNCADCVQNGLETDVDCGGDSCGPCDVGGVCQNPADCATGVCEGGTCGPAPTGPICTPLDPQNPSCADCTLNGFETDTDCGGDSCPPCDVGLACSVHADCQSGTCTGGACVPADADPPCPQVDPFNPTCADCAKNGAETDTDCGGDACSPCAAGQGCVGHGDCVSAHCDDGTCSPDPLDPGCPTPDPANPTCADCVRNGAETDTDCGGDACGPCPAGAACLGHADCASNSCVAGSCS